MEFVRALFFLSLLFLVTAIQAEPLGVNSGPFPGDKVYDLSPLCPPGKAPLAIRLGWSALLPGGSNIQFYAAVSNDPSALPPVGNISLGSTFNNPNGSINIWQLPSKRYLKITYVKNPGPMGAMPTLNQYGVEIVCEDAGG